MKNKRTGEEATRFPQRQARECPDPFQPPEALRQRSGTGSTPAAILLSPEETEKWLEDGTISSTGSAGRGLGKWFNLSSGESGKKLDSTYADSTVQ